MTAEAVYNDRANYRFRLSHMAYVILGEGLAEYVNWLQKWRGGENKQLEETIERGRRISSIVDRFCKQADQDGFPVEISLEGRVLRILRSALPYCLNNLRTRRMEMSLEYAPEEAFESINRRTETIEALLNLWNFVSFEQLMYPIGPNSTEDGAEHKGTGRRHDVALSFAGEDRDYVERVAEGLKSAGIAVFYDRYERADLWGKHLIVHFYEVYGTTARFVVPFISADYVRKAWPRLEFRSLVERLISGDPESILPVRFDKTDVPGLPNSIGYIDARQNTPEEIVSLLLEKIPKPLIA